MSDYCLIVFPLTNNWDDVDCENFTKELVSYLGAIFCKVIIAETRICNIIAKNEDLIKEDQKLFQTKLREHENYNHQPINIEMPEIKYIKIDTDNFLTENFYKLAQSLMPNNFEIIIFCQPYQYKSVKQLTEKNKYPINIFTGEFVNNLPKSFSKKIKKLTLKMFTL